MKKCKCYFLEAIKHASFWHSIAGMLGKIGILCLTYQVADRRVNDMLIIVCVGCAALGIVVSGFATWISSLNIPPQRKKR